MKLIYTVVVNMKFPKWSDSTVEITYLLLLGKEEVLMLEMIFFFFFCIQRDFHTTWRLQTMYNLVTGNVSSQS